MRKRDDINFVKEYIKSLIVNVNKAKLPSSPINLIFDGGALNGIFGCGVGLYIQELEKLGLIKVNKISGCSIGSLIALLYRCGCSDIVFKYITDIFIYYKEKHNFFEYHKIVTNIVYSIFKTDDTALLKKMLHNKLYINYYDVKKYKQKVVTRFKNREHLIDCILRSSHLPFINNGEYKYKGRYLDGCVPHIFGRGLNLFIRLIPYDNITVAFNARNEKNICVRMMKGVIEINDFFMNGHSSMINYIDSNSYSLHLQLFIRKIIYFMIILGVDAVIIFKNMLPKYIPNFIRHNESIIMVYEMILSVIQKKLL
jgi:hypothetical protein